MSYGDMFDGINEGDKVRVEFEDGATEGIFHPNPSVVPYIALGFGACLDVFDTVRSRIKRVTVLRRALPPEPPVFSVGVSRGRNLYAVQRLPLGWKFIDHDTYYSWLDLNSRFGSVNVIYTPEGGL